MSKAEASVEELVGMVERGELRLPEMQRRYVWRAPRVRDLLDSLYRGYPSGAILLWETDEAVPLRDMAVGQQVNPYQMTRLLLDGQQRLTSLAAVIRGAPVKVRKRKKPIELLFNLDHPDRLSVVTEVDEDGEDDDDDDDDVDGDDGDNDSSEDELLERFNRMTFVVATKKLEGLPQWVNHIFPRAVLKGVVTGREANDIANLCFIGGKTNRKISDKPPVEYFAPTIAKSGSAAFAAQCIPTSAELLDLGAYKTFLSRRRALITARLNEFLGIPASPAVSPQV